MARTPSTSPARPADLRRLQARLADMHVPALLRVRDAAAAALERERLEPDDIAEVLRAADSAR